VTDDEWRRVQALSFGPAAELYDAIRPTYPDEAVDWAMQPLGPGSWRVADIGAGTGKMTRVLLATGQHVVAVEPDPLMRRRLQDTTPEAEVVDGTAEALPVPDGGVDAAVAAQSYHWFDTEHAHRELERVIRHGGVFAAIWNDRDESVPWVAEYTRIIADEGVSSGDGSAERHAEPAFASGFGDVEVNTFRHTTWLTPEGLVQLMQSRSYYLSAPPLKQDTLTEEVRGLTRTHRQLAGRDGFELPYITSVYRAVRL
jgi:SAM-dependent methyltransferase